MGPNFQKRDSISIIALPTRLKIFGGFGDWKGTSENIICKDKEVKVILGHEVSRQDILLGHAFQCFIE